MKIWLELEQGSVRGRNAVASKYGYINVYVVANNGERIARLGRDNVLACANSFALKNDRSVGCDVDLQPGVVYTVVAVCKEVGYLNSIALSVFSAQEIEFNPLP